MSASSKIIVRFICKECGKGVERHKRLDLKNKFCSSRCALKEAVEASRKVDKPKEKNPFWKGGIRMAKGYRFLLRHDHPQANDKGYVQEHRLVFEEHLGRFLADRERVHHVNGVKTDNRIQNLKLYNSQSEHIKEHREEMIKKRWPNHVSVA